MVYIYLSMKSMKKIKFTTKSYNLLTKEIMIFRRYLTKIYQPKVHISLKILPKDVHESNARAYSRNPPKYPFRSLG